MWHRSWVLCLFVSLAWGGTGPNDGSVFHGRIAYSADGNHNDEDDWAASPVALALIDAFGAKERLVHFDYNSILTANDEEWAAIHRASVIGAVERYGFARELFFDDQEDLDGAVASIRDAVNASTADDPLYFIVAGPMEVPLKGIEAADRARREHVFVISHSRWNDGFAQDYTYSYNKRAVIPSGVTWVQIGDQNRYLSTSKFGRPATAEEWRPWHWMRDAADADVRFLWERMRVTTRADCSDAGMAYFLLSGDEASEIAKVRRVLVDGVLPEPLDPRPRIRLEAENFLRIEGLELEYKNERAVSHRINVRSVAVRGGIETPFREPYSAERGTYAVTVRYWVGDEQAEVWLDVNGERVGESWKADEVGVWTERVVADVRIAAEDVLGVGFAGAEVRLDYLELGLAGE